MKTKEEEIKEEIEKGVWIVYDLEANRKIQELLTSTKFGFNFRFDPSLEIIKKEAKQRFIEDEIKDLKELYDDMNNIWVDKKILEKIKELQKSLGAEQ